MSYEEKHAAWCAWVNAYERFDELMGHNPPVDIHKATLEQLGDMLKRRQVAWNDLREKWRAYVVLADKREHLNERTTTRT